MSNAPGSTKTAVEDEPASLSMDEAKGKSILQKQSKSGWLREKSEDRRYMRQADRGQWAVSGKGQRQEQ